MTMLTRLPMKLCPALACILLTLQVAHTATTATNQPPSGGTGPTNALQAIRVLNMTNLNDALASLIKNPDVYQALTYGLTHRLLQTEQTNALLGFINDLHLRPKVFHTQGQPDNAVFGFEYDFQKSLANRVLAESSLHPIGLSLTLDAKGNVAAEASKNPNNLLESGGSLHLFQGLGGISPMIKRDESFLQLIDKLQTEAGTIPPSPNWRDDPRWQESAKTASTYIVPQYFYDISAHGTLETDQQFKNKQFTYGGRLGFAARDWTDRSLARFNILDYPFAAVRWLTGADKDFAPSGRALPVVIAGIDAIDPYDNHTRLNIDPNTGTYPRARFEAFFKTRMFHLTGKDLWFAADYRYYQEIGASRAIRDANLDQQQYFVMRLDLPYNFNVSYSTGKLPLDQKSARVYAVGWAVMF